MAEIKNNKMNELKKDIVVKNTIKENTFMDYETGKLFYETTLMDLLPTELTEKIQEKADELNNEVSLEEIRAWSLNKYSNKRT